MKVIQSRIYNELANDGSAIQDRMSLMVWFLSVLNWKKLGYEPVLYTDQTTKEEFEKHGLAQLYSEIVDIGDIQADEKVFWASSKLYSVKKFMEDHPGEDFIVSDLDFIPFKDPMEFAAGDILAYHTEYWQSYKPINELNLSEDYALPDWVSGTENPVNTSVLYFKDKDMMKELMDVQFEFMTKNGIFTDTHEANDSMVFIEQRVLGEFAAHKGLKFSFMAKEGKSTFNVNAMHTGPYKRMEKSDYWKWNIWYLKMLREDFPETYELIISNELFEDIKGIIDAGEGTYKDKNGKETIIDEFSWDTLEYPRAFEDMYDPIWMN